MKPLPPIQITISGYNEDDQLALTINPHSDIHDWLGVFKTILTYQGFHHTTIAEHLDPEAYLFSEEVQDV